LGATAEKDNLSIINREPAAEHGMVSVQRLQKITERIPRHILMPAAIVLTALPLIAILSLVSANMEKRAAAEDLASASAEVDRTMDEQSPSRQPQQAFRTPDAPAPVPVGPTGNPVGNAGDTALPIADDPMVNMKFSGPSKIAPLLSQTQ